MLEEAARAAEQEEAARAAEQEEAARAARMQEAAAQEEAAQRCDALGEPAPNAATIAAAHHDKYLTATATAPVARAALVFAAAAHFESGMPHKTSANFKRIVRPAVRTALQVSVERFERWRAEAA